MKKNLIVLLFIPFLMAFQCESDDPAPLDSLETTGIFGRWEITDEIMNGTISDMLPRCCEFLEFEPDNNITDYKGNLSYTDTQGLVNNGTFEVDTNNQTILFIYDNNDEFIFDFSINESEVNLAINFSEGGINYTQNWIRID
ncbi:MAG: hypothetical protein ACX93I_09020 [Winogradskyella sp.]|jgi:hypothetical protein